VCADVCLCVCANWPSHRVRPLDTPGSSVCVCVCVCVIMCMCMCVCVDVCLWSCVCLLMCVCESACKLAQPPHTSSDTPGNSVRVCERV